MLDLMLPSVLAQGTVAEPAANAMLEVLREAFHAVTTAVAHVVLLPFIHGGFVAVARHFKHEAGNKIEHAADDVAEEVASIVADVAKKVI